MDIITKNDLTLFKDPTNNIFHIVTHAQTHHFISEQRANMLYQEMENLVFALGKQLNHNASTSLSSHSYKRIWDTLNYMFLHGFQDNGYLSLQDTSIQTYFDKGLSIVKKDVEYIQDKLQHLLSSSLSINNDRYLSILLHQIPNYLIYTNSYDALFHYCWVDDDLDYPLLDGLPLFHDMYHLQGSDLLLYYINRFSIEQQFCGCFRNELPTLFHQYEVQMGVSIEYLSINIMELLVMQVLANIILYQKFSVLLEEKDIHYLKEKLQNSLELPTLIMHALQQLQHYLPTETYNYLESFKDIFLKKYQLFVFEDIQYLIYKEPQQTNNVIMINNEDSSKNFLINLQKLQSLSSNFEKIEYMKQHVVSFYDVIDILEHDIFFDDEYLLYYKSLSISELAILLKVTITNMQAFHQKWVLNNSLFDEFDETIMWQEMLVKFLKQMNSNSKLELESILNTFQLHP